MAAIFTYIKPVDIINIRKIRKNLKEYNGDLKTLHRIQELEYDAIIDELEEEGDEEEWFLFRVLILLIHQGFPQRSIFLWK